MKLVYWEIIAYLLFVLAYCRAYCIVLYCNISIFHELCCITHLYL